MLTADFLDEIPESYLALVHRYEDSVLRDIARRLAGLDYARPTAAWQVQRLSESAMLDEDIYKALAELSGNSPEQLRDIFERAGVKTMSFDDDIYRQAGFSPLPLNLSPAMTQVMRAGYIKTQGLLQNLTNTTVISAQNDFIAAADLIHMQVVSGAMDYQSALKAQIKSLANKGVSVVHYASGRRDHVDVALRRACLTGITQTSSQLQLMRMDEMNVDLVQVSAHIGARPSHQRWQGQIFSRNGRHKKYPDFVSSTGYGTGAGLSGWNCRHSWYPFFEGISENAYSKADLKSFANQKVTYNGEPISVYDATQEQRSIERDIRYFKRQANALEAAGIDNTDEKLKVRFYQARMRDFIKQTRLSRQNVREQVWA